MPSAVSPLTAAGVPEHLAWRRIAIAVRSSLALAKSRSRG